MAVARDEQIVEAVVVIIADRYARRIADSLESGLHGYIFKCSVRFLVVQPVPVVGPIFLGNRALGHGIVNARSIREENVETAVVVIVENGDARPHGFEKIFPGGFRSLLLEVNPGLFRHVDEFSRNCDLRILRRGVRQDA